MKTTKATERHINLTRWCLRRAASELSAPSATYEDELEYCDEQISLAAREVAILTCVPGDLPHLGLATTAELLMELECRLRTTQNSIKGRELADQLKLALVHLDKGILDYTTFGSL